jgi:hypothetical protein
MVRAITICILVTITSTFSLTSCAAKAGMNEGIATYSLKVKDPSGKNFLLATALTGSEVKVYFNNRFLEYQTDMGLFSGFCVLDRKQNEGVLAMNLFGEKVASQLNGEYYERASTTDYSYEIQHSEEEQTLNGYLCKKATITIDGKNYDYWYCQSPDLSSLPTPFTFRELKGLPVMYSFEMSGMQFTLTLNDLKDRCERDFNLEMPNGYKEKPIEDLFSVFKQGAKF